ncbi:MAG: alpha/beta hydrolase [Beutenbergiaceae bacterium]
MSTTTSTSAVKHLGQLTYRSRDIDGRTLLAHDPAGPRIVEAIGDIAMADHIAIMVPGNGHHQENYLRNATKLDGLRARAELMLATMSSLAPQSRVAVVAWVGYLPPAGLSTAAWNSPAHDGAPDLARLTHYLPQDAHITLIGHSYGTVVSGLAMASSRAADCVALGSPGMGVWHRSELGAGQLWAAQGPSDWIRFFPRTRLGSLGLGRSPLTLGATRISTGDVPGHCSYYTPGSQSLLNTARIAVGRYQDVTIAGAGARESASSRPHQAVAA